GPVLQWQIKLLHLQCRDNEITCMGRGTSSSQLNIKGRTHAFTQAGSLSQMAKKMKTARISKKCSRPQFVYHLDHLCSRYEKVYRTTTLPQISVTLDGAGR
ncbi:unnamed protein product, partial [Durusdinium trenchii]